MIKFMILQFILINSILSALSVKPEEITKDGIYLNAGKNDSIRLFSELYDKTGKIKIKIIKISDNHSIACLIGKNGGCVYNINKTIKLKNKTFYYNTPITNKKEKKVIFVREDKEKFEEISQKDIETFKNTEKIFDLIIFNHDGKLKDSNYRITTMINLYTIAALELKETDLNYLNPILQTDFEYKDKTRKANIIFDANLFLQKKYSKKSFNLYQMVYSQKTGNFNFKIGRNNLFEIGDFYLTDGIFVNYKKNNLKSGILTSFGIDYYNNMKTDFDHIYIGGYLNYKKTLFKNYDYFTTLGFIPEIFKKDLGILPLYLNNSLRYENKFSLEYQLKISYSKLDTKKDFYLNQYISLYSMPLENLKLILGYDSREYLDLINYKYYQTLFQRIESIKNKNAHFNISYKFKNSLLGFTFRRRFAYGGMNDFDLRYTVYKFNPLEFSIRTSAFILKDVNIFAFNSDINYMFSNSSMLNFNLLVMLEKPKITDGKAMSFAPQISYYKKFLSYFYLKGQAEFELRTRKISAMLKLGYIFDTAEK